MDLGKCHGMRKYRRLASGSAVRGTTVTTEEQGSSFSGHLYRDHLSVCDMRHLRRRSFIWSTLFLGACTAASEHSDKRLATQSPAPAASTREAHAETVA